MSDVLTELSMTTEPAVRMNAKQKASGEWYFEATARGDTPEQVAELLINGVKAAEAAFVADGKKLVS